MPVGSCDIHENRCSESRSLLSNVKEILPPFFFFFFSSDMEKVSTAKSVKLYLLILRLVKVVLYLPDVYAFLSVVSYEICN